MVIVGALTLTILIAISAFMYGLQHFVDYLSVLSFLSQRGEAYFPNQSVNGLLNRLFFNGNNLHFADESFPPFNPVIYGSTLISSLLIITTALFWRWRDISNVDAPELAIMMLSMTIASPIAWEHHYAILLPIFAITLPLALSKQVFGKWTNAFLVGIFFLSSQRLDFTNHFADTRLNILQSYLFFAGMFMLYRISQTKRKIQLVKKDD